MQTRFLSFALAAAISLLAAGRAAAMTFEKVSGPAECGAHGCVVATGDIDGSTSSEFKAFVARNKVEKGAVVVLDSLGGQLMDSLVMGTFIRDQGFATRVQAYDHATGQFKAGGSCASACVYVFLGGVSRTAAEGARIGVHQPRTQGGDVQLSAPDGYWLMSQIAVHVNHLVGNLNLLIPTMRTPPADMHWLSANELTRYAVITPETVKA